ncbi:hypothetical protein AB5J49_22905 [Streptomyces sp. R28]|uniref:Uncharacterized protein n=1 Tax=Streptomyces sp. R28 TaxID=3238628 RepID=A0AB39Q3J4_9ACTN
MTQPTRGRDEGQQPVTCAAGAYAPLRPYAVIGDGRTAALTARDGLVNGLVNGLVDWLGLPGVRRALRRLSSS